MSARFTSSGIIGSETVSLVNEEKTVQVQYETPQGLSVLTTSLFVVGLIAGAGFLSLPKAIDDAGWIGFVLMLACCVLATYTGTILGECWTMTQRRRPDLQYGTVRYPYTAIGEEAYGKYGRHLVTASVALTQMGTAIVYVLLAAENIVKLLSQSSGFNCCYVSLIVGAVITPVTWFGTPKEFWGIAAAATLATSTASILIFISILYHGWHISLSDVPHTNVDLVTFFNAYGTICFAYSGHPCFPSYQTDMKDPRQFNKALIIGYTVIVLMYMPTAAAGYFVYGEAIKPNIINTLPQGPITTIVSVLMTTHVLFGIVLVINPVMQEIEHKVDIPDTFTWKRAVSRTLIVIVMVFIAISVPHFSSILALVGGSTITLLDFILPAFFYLKLCNSSDKFIGRPLPLHKRVIMYEILFVGLVAGFTASYSAITDLAVNKFTVPCYINPRNACPR